MPKADQQQLHRLVRDNRQMELIDRLVETDDYLRQADRVIAMGGYNTITSILSFHKPALIRTASKSPPRTVDPRRTPGAAGLDHCNPSNGSQLRSPEPMVACADRSSTSTGAVDLLGLNRISQRVSQWAVQKSKLAI